MLHPRDSRAKEMVKEDTKAEKKEMNVGEMLKDLERKLAEVKKMEAIDFKAITSKPMKAEDGEDVDPMANDLAEEMMMEAVSISAQKDRRTEGKGQQWLRPGTQLLLAGWRGGEEIWELPTAPTVFQPVPAIPGPAGPV